MVLSSPECIAWLAVFMSETVAIVILNIVTSIIFIKNSSLRMRSMYLVINLAVADVLVGGASGSMNVSFVGGALCNVWEYNDEKRNHFLSDVSNGMQLLFPITSLINTVAISLERVHATFRPFNHRVLRKRVSRITIAVVWVLAVLVSTALIVFRNSAGQRSIYTYAWCSFVSICLFVICVSYVSIFVNIYYGAHLQHHGAVSRDRKLTVTLFIVALMSLLMWLPYVIFTFFSISFLTVKLAVIALFFANSLANPILYAIRIPEFKRALVSLFRCKLQQKRVVLSLHVMPHAANDRDNHVF